MLLFIEMSVKHAIRFPNFNTSHVTVYRNSWYRPTHERIFQYISCYCLSYHLFRPRSRPRISIHLMLLFIMFRHWWLRIHCRFQYISCYCLSHFCTGNRFAVLLFQYISCYCLSRSYHLLFYSISISIHLMLLFIMQVFFDVRITCLISIHLMLLFISTCSLVTVPPPLISIHLMLLFIAFGFILFFFDIKFQYISCYCLSYSSNKELVDLKDFNTSHVTVYRYRQQYS